MTCRWIAALLLVAVSSAGAAEPEAITAIFDAAQARFGARPACAAIVADGNDIRLERCRLSIPDPIEPDNRNEHSAQSLAFSNVRLKPDGTVGFSALTVDGLMLRRAIFSMEVLQIDSLFSELGVDPPGSLGRAVDETIAIDTLEIGEAVLDPATLADHDGSFPLTLRSLSANRVVFTSNGTPLVLEDLEFSEPRMRSAGTTRRYHAGRIGLTAPWLEALAGTLFAELGYSSLTVSADAETFSGGGRSTARVTIVAPGAFRLAAEGGLSGLADNAVVAASAEAILSSSPQAAIERAAFTFADGGAARRAMSLLARQTGATPDTIAAALGQQAAQAMRRAGYSRMAREAGEAITALLTRFGRVRIAVPDGPLARFVGLGGAATPPIVERAGVTIAPVDP